VQYCWGQRGAGVNGVASVRYGWGHGGAGVSGGVIRAIWGGEGGGRGVLGLVGCRWATGGGHVILPERRGVCDRVVSDEFTSRAVHSY